MLKKVSVKDFGRMVRIFALELRCLAKMISKIEDEKLPNRIKDTSDECCGGHSWSRFSNDLRPEYKNS